MLSNYSRDGSPDLSSLIILARCNPLAEAEVLRESVRGAIGQGEGKE